MTVHKKWYYALLCVFLCLAGLIPSVQAAWSMKQARLMTPWAGQVNPDAPLPEYPRPQMVRSQWLNLNGLWQFQPGTADEQAPFGQTLTDEILVPFPVESALSGVMSHYERLWYRRVFEVPSDWNGQRILLHFGAVDWEAQVYVNGTSLGVHRGGYDAFSYDITDALLPDGPQELIVRVYDPTNSRAIACGKQDLNPSGIWYTPATGIWQTVWLEPVPQEAITSLTLTPDVDNNRLAVTVDVSDSAEHLMVQATAYYNGQEAGSVSGPAGRPMYLMLRNPRLWSPDDPFLYDLTVTLQRDGAMVDQVDSYFGMRKIEVKPVDGVNRICLNDEFIFQIGPLDQGYWPDGIYTAPTDEALKWDLEMTKAFGFNMTRKHVKVEPARWYYWADKLGLLIWQDMPSRRSSGSWDERVQFEHELRQMITQHRNHPSIILWVVFNEGWGQYDTVRVTQMAMAQDPSRLVTCASGWHDAEVGHILDYHSYPQPAAPVPTAGRASVNGEYGGIGMRVEGHMWDPASWGYTMVDNGDSLAALYDAYIQMLQSYKQAPGLSAAVYTQITDVEVEINGLITYDRQVIKPDVQRIAHSNRMRSRTWQTLLATSEQTPQTWRYTTEQPVNSWYEIGFDDSGWLSGPGGFGTEGTPGAIVRTVWNTADIWLRKSFNPGPIDPQDLDKLIFRLHHDEDAEIYINGVLAASVSGYTTAYVHLPVRDAARAALIADQENLIAVHCHQTIGGQYIDVGLALEFIEGQDDSCGPWGYAQADINRDCRVDMLDLATMAEHWLGCSLPLNPDCSRLNGPLEYDVELRWDEDSERVVFRPLSGGAWYPRLLILDDGTWLCAYDTNAGSPTTYIRVSRSTDAGDSWSYLSTASFGTGNAANAELIQLPDGDILCAYRLVSGPDKTLMVSRSGDRGATWQQWSTIVSNTEGVWEPQMIRKDDGQLLVFYAQEAGAAGTDQVIEMQRSDDNGRTWHSPQVISRTLGSRDGMPVATILDNGDILLVLEGHDIARSGQFVTWSIRSQDGGQSWGPRQPVYAPENVNHRATAPYIAAVDYGPVFVSFQTDEQGDGLFKLGLVSSTDGGYTWAVQPKPFGRHPEEAYTWNSLMAESPNLLVAATSASGPYGPSIKIIKGRIERKLK